MLQYFFIYNLRFCKEVEKTPPTSQGYTLHRHSSTILYYTCFYIVLILFFWKGLFAPPPSHYNFLRASILNVYFTHNFLNVAIKTLILPENPLKMPILTENSPLAPYLLFTMIVHSIKMPKTPKNCRFCRKMPKKLRVCQKTLH